MTVFSEKAVNRFWSRVIIGAEDDCWSWTGSKLRSGRGIIRMDKVNFVASHVPLILGGRHRPNDKPFACHSCDNPNCVNPAHLWWGDNRDNMLDAKAKGRLRGGRPRKVGPKAPRAPQRNRFFDQSWRKREPAICDFCAIAFMAVSSEIKRGKGRYCSLSCAARK